MITKEQQAALDEKLPRSQVTKRQGPGKMMLDYVEGYYVIGKLNEIFGAAGWSLEVTDTKLVAETEKNKRHCVSYLAECRIDITCEEGRARGLGAFRQDWGAGHGSDFDLGKAHESAIKEAITDALKRCAKSFGWALGLALYDKSASHVKEDTKKATPEVPLFYKIKDLAKKDPAKAGAAVTKYRHKLTSEELSQLEAFIKEK